jgi:hypothetical protein
MNMNTVDSTLYVVINYDIIEGRPAGMSEIKPLWLDVDQCGFSEAKAKSQSGSYKVNSVAWKANVDGELLVMGGMFTTQSYLFSMCCIANVSFLKRSYSRWRHRTIIQSRWKRHLR